MLSQVTILCRYIALQYGTCNTIILPPLRDPADRIMCSSWHYLFSKFQTEQKNHWGANWFHLSMEIILLHHHKSLGLASNFLRVLPLDIHTLTTYTPSLHTHSHYIHILTIYTCVCACSRDSAISGHPVGYCDMTTHFTNPRECMGAGPWNLATCWHTLLPTPHPLTRKGS